MKTSYSIINIAMLSLLLISCNDIPQVGIIKNATNGITTTYKNIIPEEVVAMMNDEIINHNQIPLGESFQVINKKIDGLTIKNDRVNVGCQLTIRDKQGDILLNIADMFENTGMLHKDSADFLRCTINTGEPMKWMEHYDVEIRYWDKFGDGELVNTMDIEMIDEP